MHPITSPSPSVLQLKLKDEHIKALFQRENDPLVPRSREPPESPTITRDQSFKWIYHKMVSIGVANHGWTIVYQAMSYLDRFLLNSEGLEENDFEFVRLARVACFLLAGKMAKLSHQQLRKCWVEVCITTKEISSMEAKVLNALNWQMSPPTPFDYFNYFLYKLKLKATKFMYAFAEARNLAAHRPSSVALALILAQCRGVSQVQDYCNLFASTLGNRGSVGLLHCDGPRVVEEGEERICDFRFFQSIGEPGEHRRVCCCRHRDLGSLDL